MKNVLQYLLRPIAFLFYALLAIAILVWWIGPLVRWGGEHPIASVTVRLSILAGLVVLALLVLLFNRWRRKHSNTRMMRELRDGPSPTDRESALLDKRFAEALQVLDDSARKSGKRSWFKPRQYLYEFPWYLFVGAPGSGKTTALLNSGLTFPLAGKMGQASVKGVGGTRNCDWWFSEEAVFIDTAGRYALQQSDAAVDAAGWANFLEMLRRTRPLRPLNGVILTLNIQDLLQQSPADRREHSANLRSRLQELHDKLGVRPPVYVLVTKCDLIAGFNESFGELGREEREQVWGMSFPYDPRGIDSPMQNFSSEFAALEKRLRDRLLDQMEREHDPLNRVAIFSFPQQFGGLKGLLGGFLESVFEGGGELEERSLLRGVYFTSGTQEGTPIDRVMGTLSRTFGVERHAGSNSARGRSFFLSRLLKEVVFAEHGLVGINHKIDARQRRWRRIGLAALALVSICLLVGWSWSFVNNRAYLAQVESRLPHLKAQIDALGNASDFDMAVLPLVLDEVLAVSQPKGFVLESPPLSHTFGLYQGFAVDEGMQTGYHHLLDHLLLQRVAQRQLERLQAGDRENLELAYESLKSYLMLYQPEHFDAGEFKTWVTLDWDESLRSTVATEQLVALARHLDAMLSALNRAALPPQDAKLVEKVRDMLVAFPLEYRIYSRLKRSLDTGEFANFSVASAGGINAVQVFERLSATPITQGIPGLFTRSAYLKALRPAIPKVTARMEAEQAWVLNVEPNDNNTLDTIRRATSGRNELEGRVKRLYLEEYINEWDSYLDDVRLVKLDSMERSLSVARLLAAPDSPVAAYIRAVVRETQLGKAVAEADSKLLIAVDEKAQTAKQELGKVVAPGGATLAAGDTTVESMVDSHFDSLARMVAGQPAPIDEVIKLFNQTYTQLSALDAAQRGRNPPPAIDGPGSASAIKVAAQLQPEPVKSMLESLAEMNTTQSRRAAREDLTAKLKPLADFCSRAITGRYPFSPSSRTDVLPDDFSQLFGPGGMIDQYYQKNLVSLVDTGVSPWSFKPLPDGTLPAGGDALPDFQRAATIRESFFKSGGKGPGFTLDVHLLELSEDAREIALDIDGELHKFTTGVAGSQTIAWPSKQLSSRIKVSMPGLPPLTYEGPWALFRLLQDFDTHAAQKREDVNVLFNIEGRHARMRFTSNSTVNPLRIQELSSFRCPSSL